MWKLAATVIERFSGFTPMKAFLKYIFQRLSNDFLDHEPNIDFRKGELQLNNLPLSAQKINQTFLMSSPYIMHSGVIRKLKITLPNLNQITSKSIELEVSGFELVFYPNKHFLQRFNQQMKQMKYIYQQFRARSKFYEQDEKVRDAIQFKEDDSLDFFKEIIRQILTNIKVNVNNICIKVFMNTPSQNQQNPKPQFYSMLRIPSIVVERSKDDQSTESEEVQKYILKVQQISTHLLRQDLKFPQYSNVKAQQTDFPFNQPSVNHPSTLMLIGNKNLKSDTQSLVFSLSIKRELKTKIKRFCVNGVIPNIEFMLEPFQIKVLEKFLSQLDEFKKLYQYSIQQLRKEDPDLFKQVTDVSRDFSVRENLRATMDFHTSMDIFSSIAMAFQQPRQGKQGRRQISYFDSIMEQSNKDMNELKADLGDFNKKVTKEIRDKIKQQRNTKFNITLKTNVDIGFVRLYILKHNSSNSLVDYERVWTLYDKDKPVKPLLINQHIPCSYFMFNVKQIGIESEDKEIISILVKKVALLNVKLAENNVVQKFRESDVFHSFQTFEDIPAQDAFKSFQGNQQIKTNLKRQLKSLLMFEKSPHQHYCTSYVLWISIKDPSKFKKRSSGYTHCLTSEFQKSKADLFSFGMNVKLIKLGTKQAEVRLKLERFGLLLDAQIAKDVTNILFPLFSYRRIVESINLKKQELSSFLEQKNTLHSSSYKQDLSFSSYDLSVVPEVYEIQQQSAKSSRTKLLLEVTFNSTISLGFIDLSLFESDLVSAQKKKMKDNDSFVCPCFCEYSHECVSVQINKLKIRSDYREKIFFKDSYVWLKSLSHERPPEKVMIVGTSDQTLYNRLFIQTIKNKTQTQQRVSLHVPYFKINIQKKECLKAIKMIEKLGYSYKSLFDYFKYLSSQFKRMDKNHSSSTQIKSKKPSVPPAQTFLLLHIRNLEASILDVELYISDLLFCNQPKQTVLKLNALLLLHLQKAQPLLKSVPIDIKTTIKNTNKQIDTSAVVLRINSKEKQIEAFSPETKDRDFFKKLEQHSFSVVVQISQNQEKLDQNSKITDLKNSGKFGFMKRKQLETISEEEDQKVINITISQPILVRPCQAKNFMLLKQDIAQLQSVVETSKLTQLFSQQASFDRRRKDSDWAPQRKVRINLKLKELSFDIFPYDDLKQSSTIISSTRSYLSFQNVLVQIQSTEKASEMGEHLNSNTVNLEVKKTEVFFIYFNDTDPSKNPLLICKDELLNYGFKKICTLNSISATVLHQLSIWTKQTLIELSLKIDSVDGECSAMTTVYLQHHIDTVVRMMDFLFPKPFDSSSKKGMIQVIEELDSDDEAIDIDEMQRNFKKEEEIKNSEQNQFKNRTTEFLQTLPQNLIKSIVLKQLQIKRVSFSIFSGDDFNFLEPNEKPITEETILELNDKNEIVIREEPEGTMESRKRFRRKDVDKYTNMRFVGEGIVLELCKYKEKKKEQSALNVRAVFKVRTVNWIVNKLGEDIFYLLKVSERFSIAFQISGTKIKAKHFLPDSIYAGYTSELNFLWKERQLAQDHLNKMAYLIPIQQSEQLDINFKQTIYEILALVPRTKLILNLQMIGWKFLTNQQITTLELFFHNKLSKYMQDDNNKAIMKWITDTLTNNMGSILANGFISLFSKAIWFFLSCIKQVILFPGKVFRVLKKK